MNILLVGGAGYLGGALTNLLMNSKHNILVYDLLLYEESYRKSVPFVNGDIRDTKKLQSHLDWADVVVWLAALVGDPACALNETLTMEINKDSIQYLKDHYEGRIIYFSSCSVYGAADKVLNEQSYLNPLSLYAKAKIWGEEILASHSNALIFRLGTLYGISDEFSRIRFDLVVNTLAMRAALHKKINVFGGKQYRPLLHVRDVASTVVSCLDKKNTGIYNLQSENITIIELADQVKKYFPSLRIKISDTKFQDNRDYRVSSDKAKRELNFHTELTVEDGIKELKELLEQGRVKNSFINRYSNYLYLKPLLDEYNSPLGKLIKSEL